MKVQMTLFTDVSTEIRESGERADELCCTVVGPTLELSLSQGMSVDGKVFVQRCL